MNARIQHQTKYKTRHHIRVLKTNDKNTCSHASTPLMCRTTTKRFLFMAQRSITTLRNIWRPSSQVTQFRGKTVADNCGSRQQKYLLHSISLTETTLKIETKIRQRPKNNPTTKTNTHSTILNEKRHIPSTSIICCCCPPASDSTRTQFT